MLLSLIISYSHGNNIHTVSRSLSLSLSVHQLPNYSTAPKKKKDEADTPLLKAINTVDSSSPLLSTTTTATNTDTTKPILPFYSSSLLSDTNFIWVSGNNINDGRTGILNKKEYLAAGRYFDLRSSFPDLEYRAHDFRVVVDEEGGYSSSSSSSSSSDGGGDRITVRFTTLVTGTFRGSSLKLRSKLMEPNGKVMNCPPTSVSITFATAGPEKGKIVKLVTDMVSGVVQILSTYLYFMVERESLYATIALSHML